MSDDGGRGGHGEPGSADDALLADLRRVARIVDDVPADVTLAARSAIAHRLLDVRLAELLHDSHDSDHDTERKQLAGVRGAVAERQLTFAAGDELEIELEVHADDAGRHVVVGQVVAGALERVEAEQPDHGVVASAAVDEVGGFELTGLVGGPLRLELSGAVAAVVTPWFRL